MCGARWWIAAFMLLGIGCLGASVVGHWPPLFVWNASASAPIGLYAVLPERSVSRGHLVLVDPRDDVRSFAAERRYLPLGVRLIKRVAALSGDQICSQNSRIFINGMFGAIRLSQDRAGRPMPFWTGCRTLGESDVFLLMRDIPDSFDGRYFGVVPRQSIIGRLIPLWTR
jgi:conjugative transfer signal peptidase TraF